MMNFDAIFIGRIWFGILFKNAMIGKYDKFMS